VVAKYNEFLPKCPLRGPHGDTGMGGDVVEYMKKAVGNAKLKTLPSGHLSVIEDPEKFNRAVLNSMQDLQ